VRARAHLDQLDLVAVGRLDEGDHGRAVLHRAGLAGDLHAPGAQRLAGGPDVGNADRDVAEGGAEPVARRLVGAGLGPVVGELEDRRVGLFAIADEGEREATARVVLAAQQPHAEPVAPEAQGGVEIADAEHRVQEAHAGQSNPRRFPVRGGSRWSIDRRRKPSESIGRHGPLPRRPRRSRRQRLRGPALRPPRRSRRQRLRGPALHPPRRSRRQRPRRPARRPPPRPPRPPLPPPAAPRTAPPPAPPIAPPAAPRAGPPPAPPIALPAAPRAASPAPPPPAASPSARPAGPPPRPPRASDPPGALRSSRRAC